MLTKYDSSASIPHLSSQDSVGSNSNKDQVRIGYMSSFFKDTVIPIIAEANRSTKSNNITRVIAFTFIIFQMILGSFFFQLENTKVPKSLRILSQIFFLGFADGMVESGLRFFLFAYLLFTFVVFFMICVNYKLTHEHQKWVLVFFRIWHCEIFNIFIIPTMMYTVNSIVYYGKYPTINNSIFAFFHVFLAVYAWINVHHITELLENNLYLPATSIFVWRTKPLYDAILLYSIPFSLSPISTIFTNWAKIIPEIILILISPIVFLSLYRKPYEYSAFNASCVSLPLFSIVAAILSIVNEFVGDKLSIYIYYFVPIFVLIASEIVGTFVLHLQFKKILKILKTDADLNDNDKIELFDSLKLTRIDLYYALQIGIQNRCNLFLDWSLPHYLVNNNPEDTDLLIFATWLISFFPSETKTLNSFLVKIGHAPTLNFHQQCLFFQLHRIYIFRESSASAEAANDFKPVFEQSEKCVAYISVFWKIAATFPEDIHNRIFEEMATIRRQSENMWKEILEKYPNNAQMMQEYARFLANGQSKFHEAIRVHQKAIFMETGQRIRNDKAFRCFLLKFPEYLKKGYVDNTGRLLKKAQRNRLKRKTTDSDFYNTNIDNNGSYNVNDPETMKNNNNNNNNNNKSIRPSESLGNVSTINSGYGNSDGSTIDSNTSSSSFLNGKAIDMEEAHSFLPMTELRTAMERSIALFTTPIVSRIRIASIFRLFLTVGLCGIVWGITVYTFPMQKILFSHLVHFDKLSQTVSLITNQLNWFWITAYPDIPDDYEIFVQNGFDVNDDTFVNMKGAINLTIYNMTRVALGQLDNFANDMYTSDTNDYLTMFSEHYSKLLVNNSICADSKDSDFVVSDPYSITVDYILRSYLTLITKMMNDKDFKRQTWDTKDNFCEGFIQSYVIQASFENLLKSISPSVDEVDPEDNTFDTYRHKVNLINELSYGSSRILDITNKFDRESFINDMKKFVIEENERIMNTEEDNNNDDDFVNLTREIIGMPGKFKRIQEGRKKKNAELTNGHLIKIKNVILPFEKKKEKSIFYRFINKIFNISIFSNKKSNNNTSTIKINNKNTEKLERNKVLVNHNNNPNSNNKYRIINNKSFRNIRTRKGIKRNNNISAKSIIIGDDGDLTFIPYDKSEDKSLEFVDQNEESNSLNFLVGFTPFFAVFFALPSLVYLASALHREKQKLKELLLRTNEHEAMAASDVVTGHSSTAISVHMSSVDTVSYTWLWNAFSVLIVCICLVLIIVMGMTKESKQDIFVQHFIFNILQRNAVCDIGRDLVYNAFHYQMETYGIRIHSFDPEKNKTKKGTLTSTAFSCYKMTKERLEYDFAYYDRISNLIQVGSKYVKATSGFAPKVDQIRSQVNYLNSYDFLPNGEVLTTTCEIKTVDKFKECISFDRLLTYFIGQAKLIYRTPSLYNVTDEAIVELVYLIFTKITAEYDKLNKVYNDSFIQTDNFYSISCLILFILSLVCTFGSFIVELVLLNKFLGELDVIRSLLLRLNPLYFVSNPELLATVYKRGKTDSFVTSSSHAMFQTSNDSLILVNADLIIENVNPAATRIFGYTPEQMLGQNIKFILPHDLNSNLYYVVDLMSSGATSLNYENDATGNRDDGTEIPLRLSLVGFTSMGGSSDLTVGSESTFAHNNNDSNNKGNKGNNNKNLFAGKKIESIDMNSINGSKQAVGFAFILRDMTEEQRQKMMVEDAKKQAELILLQILPKDIIMRLNRGDKDITFTVDSSTVIFIDIEKFSQYSSSLSAKDIMLNLSKIFTAFDKICNTFNLITKIKMIGDDYMAAAGLFQTDVNPQQHAVQVLQFAMQCLEALEEQNVLLNASLQVRIGINTDGPLIAGILGTEKPLFDIIGDPINVAARLQSTDIAGLIQISEGTYKLVADLDYKIEERGEIELKGKGKRRTYLVYPEESTEQAKQFLASDIDSAISTAVLQQIVNHDSSSIKMNSKSKIIGGSSIVLSTKK